VKVAAVAELAVRPVVAGLAGPALTPTDDALRCHVFLLYPLYRSRGGEEEGQTLRAREEIGRSRGFHLPYQVHLQRCRRSDVGEPPRSGTFDLRPETAEAQRVVAIGADLPAILEPRAVHVALQADVTVVTVQTTSGGWGHGSVSVLWRHLRRR
jgi:hypothetical protein